MKMEDLEYTIHNFLYDKNFKEMSYSESLEICENIAEAVNIIQKRKYGDCFLISDFIKCVKSGSFTNYDGFGIFIDKEGNEIHTILNVDYYWVKNNQPKNAKYVLWFNK